MRVPRCGDPAVRLACRSRRGPPVVPGSAAGWRRSELRRAFRVPHGFGSSPGRPSSDTSTSTGSQARDGALPAAYGRGALLTALTVPSARAFVCFGLQGSTKGWPARKRARALVVSSWRSGPTGTIRPLPRVPSSSVSASHPSAAVAPDTSSSSQPDPWPGARWRRASGWEVPAPSRWVGWQVPPSWLRHPGRSWFQSWCRAHHPPVRPRPQAGRLRVAHVVAAERIDPETSSSGGSGEAPAATLTTRPSSGPPSISSVRVGPWLDGHGLRVARGHHRGVS